MTPHGSPPSQDGEPERSRCILAVNDNDDELFLIARHLRKVFPGAMILTARDGREALDTWRREQVHAIVTDNKMPQITGLNLIREIRETDSTVPIIMATGSERDRDEALATGATVFYTESNPEGITDALKKCFGE